MKKNKQNTKKNTKKNEIVHFGEIHQREVLKSHLKSVPKYHKMMKMTQNDEKMSHFLIIYFYINLSV